MEEVTFSQPNDTSVVLSFSAPLLVTGPSTIYNVSATSLGTKETVVRALHSHQLLIFSFCAVDCVASQLYVFID